MTGTDDAAGAGLFRPGLCRVGLVARSDEHVMRALAARLLAAGAVRPSFAGALVARERVSPTGLPFGGPDVAIPHADPEHVLVPCAAACTLAAPVAFGEMGSAGGTVQVHLVVALALPDKERAQRELVALLGRLQDEPLRRALVRAPSDAALLELLRAGGGS